MRSSFLLAAVLTLALVGVLVLAPSVGLLPGSRLDASVAPVFVAGNPSCTDLGYAFGVKLNDTDPNGGYLLTVPGVGEIDIKVNSTDQLFDWLSDFGIDAVIAKGGPNANVYVYDPPAESFGDTELQTPINDSNGQPYGISHIEFCYDLTNTPTPTSTSTATSTATATTTATGTTVPSATPTNTPTGTTVPSDTPTNTPTGTTVPSDTPTNTPTVTVTPEVPTNTPTGTVTPELGEASPTPTNTATPTGTTVPSDTPTSTPTVTLTPDPGQSPTPTNTPTVTLTPDPGQSPTPTPTITLTPDPGQSPTPTNTQPPGQGPSATPTNTQPPGVLPPTATNTQPPGDPPPTATNTLPPGEPPPTNPPAGNPLPTPTFTPLAVCAGLSVPSLALSADPAQALPGATVRFTVVVGNPTDIAVPPATITTDLAVLAEFVSVSTTRGDTSYDAGRHAVSLHLQSVAPGETITLTIEVRLADTAAPGSPVAAISTGSVGGFNCVRAATSVTVTPAGIPVTGFGPGPMELMVLGTAGLGLLGALLLAGGLVVRRAARRN